MALELQQLAKLASTEPHAAYAALNHGLRGRWVYLLRTLEFLTYQLDALEATINQRLLPALHVAGRRYFSDEELCLLQFPCRLGRIDLPSFRSMDVGQFKASCDITALVRWRKLLHQQDASWFARSCDFVSEMARHERASVAAMDKTTHAFPL